MEKSSFLNVGFYTVGLPLTSNWCWTNTAVDISRVQKKKKKWSKSHFWLLTWLVNKIANVIGRLSNFNKVAWEYLSINCKCYVVFTFKLIYTRSPRKPVISGCDTSKKAKNWKIFEWITIYFNPLFTTVSSFVKKMARDLNKNVLSDRFKVLSIGGIASLCTT